MSVRHRQRISFDKLSLFVFLCILGFANEFGPFSHGRRCQHGKVL